MATSAPGPPSPARGALPREPSADDAVDRQAAGVEPHAAGVVRDLHVAPGGGVVEAGEPVGPRIQQRDAHRLAVLGVGGDAGVLGEQLLAAVAQRAAKHAGAGDERGLERGVLVTQVQRLERAIGHARRAQYCDDWRITLSTEHEGAAERPASALSEDLHAHARATTSPPELTREQIERLESIYGNRYLLEAAPDHKLPRPACRRGKRRAWWSRRRCSTACRRATSRLS